uniref:Carboxypeptidase Q n=1 Tax=Spodoptera frugiperda TaxID=7108 RepID=A0A2H1W0X3_SPOFR
MTALKLLFIFPLIIIKINANFVITRYDDECVLDPALVTEIASYENVTKHIMDQIRDYYGKTMYQEYTRFIDKFGARPSGTWILEKSIDHMIDLTKQHGLYDVTTEELEVPYWLRLVEYAMMVQPRFKKIAILGFGSSVSTPSGGINAEVIVVRSFAELEKLDRTKVQGKIVVFNEPYVSYGETVIYRTQGASKAARKGAVATLVRSITPFSIYAPHTGAQYYESNVTKIPTAAITLEDADLLQRLQEEGEKIVLEIQMAYMEDTKKSRNTLVDLKGKESPEKLVIVSGHIDSWDVGEGAMDDGGGMMISWLVPVVLNSLNLKPRRTVRAILWTAEEPGLIGAQAYLKQHKDELDKINFIMESDEGTFQPLGLDVAGSNKTRCIVQEVLKQFAPINKMENSGAPGSDIVLFIKQNVPGASLLNKNERYYWFHHSEGDTMNVQNMTNVIECAAFWAAFSYVIADLSVDLPRN